MIFAFVFNVTKFLEVRIGTYHPYSVDGEDEEMEVILEVTELRMNKTYARTMNWMRVVVTGFLPLITIIIFNFAF